jgi:membrane-bound ClpP family serine protease
LLGQLAPTIATALGGPLAGVAVKTLSNALFGHEDATEDQISDAMASATPDQLAAIKKIDADFKVQMKSLDIDLERISAGDRDSARQMQRETKDWVPKVLAIVITLGFFGILIWMLLKGMPQTGTEALLMMLGALGTAWTGVINFYYGSSAGSKAKTDAMNTKGDR